MILDHIGQKWGKQMLSVISFCKNNIFCHMRRFPEPQHFFAAEWQKWDFAIAIIFYPVIKTSWKSLCILFGCCSIQLVRPAGPSSWWQCFQKLPKVTKSYQKLPKVTKSCQKLPKVAKRCQKLPNIAKSCQKLPKVAKSSPKLPKVAKSSTK